MAFQPRENRWVSTFTELQSRRQMRLYASSALLCALRRDFVRLADGIRPRKGESEASTTWVVLANPDMTPHFVQRVGTGTIQGKGTLQYRNLRWVGPHADEMEAASRRMGALVDMGNWRDMLRAAGWL